MQFPGDLDMYSIRENASYPYYLSRVLLYPTEGAGCTWEPRAALPLTNALPASWVPITP